MSRREVAEVGLFRHAPEGSSIETGSLWGAYLSALGRSDAELIQEQHGITNAWFPFPRNTLRQLLKSRSDEINFDQWQQDLFHHTHWPIADPNEFVHVALEDADDYMEINHHFGDGAFGHVEQVTLPSAINSIICVRKKISRPKALSAQQAYFKSLAREINVMRQVSHHHCVRLLGSYTDHDSMGILLLPVADMDLATFLNLTDLSILQSQFLRQSIGCLCSALDYLHKKQIRHEDLKPQNILVQGDHILLADFGFRRVQRDVTLCHSLTLFSLDFSDDAVSTTTGRPSGCTPRYAAPEVLEHAPRNRATDVYSLGCIMIEILSCLYGHQLSDVKKYWKDNGNNTDGFHRNEVARKSWCSYLAFRLYFRGKDRVLLKYAEYMLFRERKGRPSAQLVVQRIQELENRIPENFPIIGRCCRNFSDCYKEGKLGRNISQMSIRKLWLRMAPYWTSPLSEDHDYVVLNSNLELFYEKKDHWTGWYEPSASLEKIFASPKQVRAGCEALILAVTKPSATGRTSDFWRTLCHKEGHLTHEHHINRIVSDSLSHLNPWRVHMISLELYGSVRRPPTSASLLRPEWLQPNTIKIFAVPTCYLSKGSCELYFYLISWESFPQVRSVF